jgi:hypothetical protein
MILRFVQGSSLISRAIIAQSKTAMPFTPSHVETVSEDGLSYIGAHIDGGVQARPVGYDKADTVHELLLPLAATPEQDRIFHDFMRLKIGEPYDWHAIIGFLIPAHEHAVNTAVCSAVAALALRTCLWFEKPLAAPAHLISPRDLLLIISGRMEIPGI